jgi:hypothetical protein
LGGAKGGRGRGRVKTAREGDKRWRRREGVEEVARRSKGEERDGRGRRAREGHRH